MFDDEFGDKFVTKFGDEFDKITKFGDGICDKFGDEFCESPNMVKNSSPYFVMNFVICQVW